MRCVDGFDNAENVVAGCVLSGFVTGVMGPAAGARNGAVRRTTERIVVGRGWTIGVDGGGGRLVAIRNPQSRVVDLQPRSQSGATFFYPLRIPEK